jgi:hypothetical protein
MKEIIVALAWDVPEAAGAWKVGNAPAPLLVKT